MISKYTIEVNKKPYFFIIWVIDFIVSLMLEDCLDVEENLTNS